ncbi:MAG TPA: STAS domain-containing protein [Rudaea sp.]|nr:STAS domain-containing protein [Rudaea sp.]
MAIEIQQEQQGATRILALSGRLDTDTSADVELTLQDLLGAGERNFLIDLTGIGYVSSAGLRVLLATAKQLEGGKGSLRLCGLNPSVRQVFDVAGFSKLFALFPDRATALGEAGNAKIKPEVVLAQKAAALLSVKATTEPLHPKAVELARIATQLLGLKTMPASAGRAMPPPAPSRPPAKAASKPTDDAAQAGVLGKIRGIFSGKS